MYYKKIHPLRFVKFLNSCQNIRRVWAKSIGWLCNNLIGLFKASIKIVCQCLIEKHTYSYSSLIKSTVSQDCLCLICITLVNPWSLVVQAGESCVEYGVLYDGAVLGTGSRVADDTASCRQYCHRADTCRAFAFSKREGLATVLNYYLLHVFSSPYAYTVMETPPPCFSSSGILQ